MAKPKPTHPIACFLLRLIVRCKRGVARLCPYLWLQHVLTLFGFLTHLVPWLVIRIVTLWIIVPGDFSRALNRLLWSLPVYVFWFGFTAYWVREYCLLWVTVAWMLLLPIGGVLTLSNTQLRQRLRIRYQLAPSICASLGVVSLLVLSLSVSALIRISPIEFLRGNAPDFAVLSTDALDERLSADEQQLALVLAGLRRLNDKVDTASPAPSVTPNSPEASAESTSVITTSSQQRQAEFLRYHTALRRLEWSYHNHGRLSPAPQRQRAAALHLTAGTAASEAATLWSPRLDAEGKVELHSALASREPRHGEALLNLAWTEKLRPFLQPGDILLIRSNGYRSNGYLPGAWTQLSLYIGTNNQLQQAGLDQDMRVQRHLEKLAAPDAKGHPASVIRVDGNGVGLSSLELTVGEADSVAVLRPKLKPVQHLEMVSRAFTHLGKPYDYDFDFAHADKLLCSELVARTLEGVIDFPLETIAGQTVLTGDGLVEFWASGEGGPLLEFVAYVNGNEANGECNWAGPGDLALAK